MDATSVCNHLRHWFCTFSGPQELSSDGGPPFESEEYHHFLLTWGVTKRQSSAYYPQSNGRATLAVKTAKRILTTNTDGSGSLNHDKVACALLTYRNTPVQGMQFSSAIMIYGRPIKDHLPSLQPIHSGRRLAGETSLAKWFAKSKEAYDKHTHTLQQLIIGDEVLVQNQMGPHPKRWSRTGTIVEVMPHWQYRIRVHGSNRVTLRNRKFLRKFTPVPNHHSTSGEPTQLNHRSIPPLQILVPDLDLSLDVPDLDEPWETQTVHTVPLSLPTHESTGESHLSNLNNWKPTQFQLHPWRTFPSILNTISLTHLVVVVAREDHVATCHFSCMVNRIV